MMPCFHAAAAIFADDDASGCRRYAYAAKMMLMRLLRGADDVADYLMLD